MSLRFGYKGLLPIAVLLVLAMLAMPGSHMGRGAYQTKSFNQMGQIAAAIGLYSQDHQGALPQNLGNLVPDYLPDPQELLFHSPYSNPETNVDLLAHKEMIEMLSPYAFQKLPDGRILVVERPGFWKDGRITYYLPGNDGEPVGNSSSCHVTPEEFAHRLSNGFPDHPLAGDYQKSQIASVDSSEYVLDYTGQELQAIHQAFQASGEPPIPPGAARLKVEAEMKRIDPRGSWEVDTGNLTSDGSTPYYHFRCVYLKDGREMGGTGALVLLDGTVVAPRKISDPAQQKIQNRQ